VQAFTNAIWRAVQFVKANNPENILATMECFVGSTSRAGRQRMAGDVPSTMAWLFASLSPAISFSLIGVIVGEFIGAEHGIGRMIIEAEARGEAAGMMVAVFVLMIAGVILSSVVRRLQAYQPRWRPAQTATGS